MTKVLSVGGITSAPRLPETLKVILEALSRAVADDADIITMSFTGWNFSSADPIAIAASQIVESGKVFVAAAGDLVGPVFNTGSNS